MTILDQVEHQYGPGFHWSMIHPSDTHAGQINHLPRKNEVAIISYLRMLCIPQFG